jgi:hypothetical protein
LLIAFPAIAAGNCGKRANLLQHLKNKFGENPVAIGVTDNGGVVEILASENGSTWTLIVTMPYGESCMIATGKYWETAPQVRFEPKA